MAIDLEKIAALFDASHDIQASVMAIHGERLYALFECMLAMDTLHEIGHILMRAASDKSLPDEAIHVIWCRMCDAGAEGIGSAVTVASAFPEQVVGTFVEAVADHYAQAKKRRSQAVMECFN